LFLHFIKVNQANDVQFLLQPICLSNIKGGAKVLLEFDFLVSWDDPDAEVERFCSGGLSSLPSKDKRKIVSDIMVKTKYVSTALETNTI
jgi:hypothetical protein